MVSLYDVILLFSSAVAFWRAHTGGNLRAPTQGDGVRGRVRAEAAKQGHAGAQYNLARLYDDGRGVDQNDEKAMRWYEKAAVQGHVDAQFNLATMYKDGQGMDQSDSMAMRWFAKAAAQGDEEAQAEIDQILAKHRAFANRPAAAETETGPSSKESKKQKKKGKKAARKAKK